ncbi:MAG: S8 family serine peptidase [Thermoplasmatota archaeon]
MRAGSILAVFVLVAPLAAATAFAPAGAAATRVAVLTTRPIGFPIVGGDPRVGFVVVDTRDLAALRAIFGDRVVPNAAAWAADTPDDPLWADQWGPQALNMSAAWQIENGSTSVKVAVVDSGLDETHPDFRGVPIQNGTDYVDHDLTPEDANGHGTHVAGIIAAVRDNGIGIAGLARVTLIPIRVLDANGNGNCIDVALAVLEAAARGATIINLSLECSTDYAPLHLAIQAVTQEGVLVVAAAGNIGAGPCPAFPGAYPEVLSVAALANATSVAPYSCRGTTVEIAAPGSSVISTWLGGGYETLSGTSMAAPHVSGIAALLKAHFPAMNGSAIRARLDATAVDLGPPGRDDASGYGRVNPVAALGNGSM